MAAFHHHTHSSADLPSGTVTPTSGLDPGSASAPKTPPPIPDSLIDPALFTPSKRGSLLATAPAGSSSGSFLVADTKLTSDQRIAPPVLEHTRGLPMPDWSLLEKKEEYQTRDDMQKQIEELTNSLRHAHIQVQAQNSVIEGAHAQLVVQDMYLGRLNESLNVHEKKKPNDHTQVFPDGQGRLLTDDQFQAELAKAAEKTQEKAAAQEKAKAKREAKKAFRQAVDDLWKVRAEEHKQAVQAWETECTELQATGVLKKNLPKWPVRMTKAQIMEEMEGLEASSDEGLVRMRSPVMTIDTVGGSDLAWQSCTLHVFPVGLQKFSLHFLIRRWLRYILSMPHLKYWCCSVCNLHCCSCNGSTRCFVTLCHSLFHRLVMCDIRNPFPF
jgi:hypothetical protein